MVAPAWVCPLAWKLFSFTVAVYGSKVHLLAVKWVLYSISKYPRNLYPVENMSNIKLQWNNKVIKTHV